MATTLKRVSVNLFPKHLGLDGKINRVYEYNNTDFYVLTKLGPGSYVLTTLEPSQLEWSISSSRHARRGICWKARNIRSKESMAFLDTMEQAILAVASRKELKEHSLSEVGQKLEKLFLEKRAKYPEVRLCEGNFGITGEETKALYVSENNRCCPIGLSLLGEHYGGEDSFEKDLVSLVNGSTLEYFYHFWRGFDNIWTHMFGKKEAYKDGQYFRKKYLPKECV